MCPTCRGTTRGIPLLKHINTSSGAYKCASAAAIRTQQTESLSVRHENKTCIAQRPALHDRGQRAATIRLFRLSTRHQASNESAHGGARVCGACPDYGNNPPPHHGSNNPPTQRGCAFGDSPRNTPHSPTRLPARATAVKSVPASFSSAEASRKRG